MEQKVIEQLVETVLADYGKGRDIDRMDLFSQPDSEEILDILRKLQIILFPGYYRDGVYKFFSDRNRVSVLIEDVIFHLRRQIRIALLFDREKRMAAAWHGFDETGDQWPLIRMIARGSGSSPEL